ncbi:MAG: hypothetical protein CSA86_01290 [Arcobacter sp.]|nr:MAG: hypothetical protein CSA86_01290 [Arcobacter sp.]
MIIIIKTGNKNQLLIKVLSMLSLLLLFGLYYNHMSSKFQDQNNALINKLDNVIVKKEIDKSLNIEKAIYKEAVVIVNLLEQKHVQSIKIVKNKLYIICDYTTDIEPLLIRYGVAAMIKNTNKNIQIAIDLKTIVENKYEA